MFPDQLADMGHSSLDKHFSTTVLMLGIQLGICEFSELDISFLNQLNNTLIQHPPAHQTFGKGHFAGSGLFFIAYVHVSELALTACPGAAADGMALMPPSAVAEGVLVREASRRVSGPACARAP